MEDRIIIRSKEFPYVLMIGEKSSPVQDVYCAVCEYVSKTKDWHLNRSFGCYCNYYINNAILVKKTLYESGLILDKGKCTFPQFPTDLLTRVKVLCMICNKYTDTTISETQRRISCDSCREYPVYRKRKNIFYSMANNIGYNEKTDTWKCKEGHKSKKDLSEIKTAYLSDQEWCFKCKFERVLNEMKASHLIEKRR